MCVVLCSVVMCYVCYVIYFMWLLYREIWVWVLVWVWVPITTIKKYTYYPKTPKNNFSSVKPKQSIAFKKQKQYIHIKALSLKLWVWVPINFLHHQNKMHWSFIYRMTQRIIKQVNANSIPLSWHVLERIQTRIQKKQNLNFTKSISLINADIKFNVEKLYYQKEKKTFSLSWQHFYYIFSLRWTLITIWEYKYVKE